MKYISWTIKNKDLDIGGYGNLPPLLCMLLKARGIENPDAVHSFLRGGQEQLHDPFLLRDMDAAADRLNYALKCGEKVVVYGD